MKRRAFIAGAGATAAWSFAAWAQQTSTVPVVGFLHGGVASAVRPDGVRLSKRAERNWFRRWPQRYHRIVAGHMEIMIACRNLRKTGSVSSYRRPGYQRRLGFCSGGQGRCSPASRLFFLMGSDPVKAGLVSSLSRPGRQCNGRYCLLWLRWSASGSKSYVQLLPSLTVVLAFINSSNPNAEDVTYAIW